MPIDAAYETIGGVLADGPEQRVKEGEIMFTNLGNLREFAAQKNALPATYPASEIWTGVISKDTLTINDPEAGKLIEAALEPSNLEKYFVPANTGARTRCIDGRLLDGYLTDDGLINPELAERDLGPQVPGGTPAAALVHRVIKRDWAENPTLGNDIRDISKMYSEHGIRMGGHIDEHKQDHPYDSGCGAIDNMPQIMQRITSLSAIGELKGLVRALMGDAFDADLYDMVEGRIRLLESMQRTYFGEYEQKDGEKEYEFKKEAIAVLNENAEKEHHPVAKLTGSHQEVALVVNLVPETTFDRDRFWAANQGRVQLFNYDLWRSEEFAQILYPVDIMRQTPAENDKRQLEQRLFLTARIMYAVATSMVLTDGSLDIILRINS